jgi:ornithine carbamoyltransferase
MTTVAGQKKDFLSVLDLAPEALDACLAQAAEMKRRRAAASSFSGPLAGRHVALLFEKPSLRTRSTFTIAVRELGGDVLEPPADVALGGRESAADVARNLERWVSAVVVRTFAQARLEAFAAAAPSLPVINALTDEEHPCQALADCQTLLERWGTLRGRTVVFVGDGNNVARSLSQASVRLGATVRVASPEGYLLPSDTIGQANAAARFGGSVSATSDVDAAIRGADAIYTDVWASMGQEEQAKERRRVFERYRVTGDLMGKAAPGALFMHCLPAHRGHEVTDEVIDSPASVVFDQAENRLHTQKALLSMLVKGSMGRF